MIGKVMIEQELMKLQEESNKKEMQRRNNLLDNRCRKCKVCILEKYYEMVKYDEFLVECLPKQGDIWSKEYQCKEILKILKGKK